MKKGRPKAVEGSDIDLAEFEVFGKMAATHEEMADHFGVTVRTIERYMADKEGPFCRAYKKGLSTFKQKLRRIQIQQAEGGSVPMQIWLGKNLLGQSDKTESKHEHSGPEGGPININVNFH